MFFALWTPVHLTRKQQGLSIISLQLFKVMPSYTNGNTKDPMSPHSQPPPFKSSLRWTLRRWSTGKLCPDFKVEKQKRLGKWSTCELLMIYVEYVSMMLHGENSFRPCPQHIFIAVVVKSMCTTFPRTSISQTRGNGLHHIRVIAQNTR